VPNRTYPFLKYQKFFIDLSFDLMFSFLSFLTNQKQFI